MTITGSMGQTIDKLKASQQMNLYRIDWQSESKTYKPNLIIAKVDKLPPLNWGIERWQYVNVEGKTPEGAISIFADNVISIRGGGDEHWTIDLPCYSETLALAEIDEKSKLINWRPVEIDGSISEDDVRRKLKANLKATEIEK